MSIIFDHPIVWAVPALGGREMPCAHLISTFEGPLGQHELIAFAIRLGFKRTWIQNMGQWGEHFDLLGTPTIERARVAGAVQVDRNEIVRVWKLKRRLFAEKGGLLPPVSVSAG